MELSTEFIETNKLTPEQVTAFTEFGKNHEAELKKQFEGTANTNAEKILEGVGKSLQSKFGVSIDRTSGEKHADYIGRLSEKVFEQEQQKVKNAQAEYDKKLKEFKGDEATKEELQTAKQKLDDAQKKLADYDELQGKATKYDELITEHGKLKVGTAFASVKPNFPETVNTYEAAHKWEKFQSGILEKYNIEIVDGEAMAIDKENEHRQKKLSELVAADAEISALVAGRQQNGLNVKTGENTKIEGVPFAVPKDCTPAQRTELIEAQIAKEGIPFHDPKHAARHKELNDKIRQAAMQ